MFSCTRHVSVGNVLREKMWKSILKRLIIPIILYIHVLNEIWVVVTVVKPIIFILFMFISIKKKKKCSLHTVLQTSVNVCSRWCRTITGDKYLELGIPSAGFVFHPKVCILEKGVNSNSVAGFSEWTAVISGCPIFVWFEWHALSSSVISLESGCTTCKI